MMKIKDEIRWNSDFVERLLKSHPHKFGFVTDNPQKFRFQVILSELTNDQNPRFIRYAYRLGNEYFYPASTIKLCAVVAVAQKLRQLQSHLGMEVTCITPLSFYPLIEDNDVSDLRCSNGTTEITNVAQEIRKLFLVSDNTAFNRLYAIMGQGALNQAMWSLGLQSTRIFHRLSMHLSAEQNRTCEPIGLDLNGVPVLLPPKKSKLPIPDAVPSSGIYVGNAYLDEDENLIEEPIDFSKKNCINLLDLQNLLVKLVRNDIELEGKSIDMDESFRIMLKEAMCQYPKDSCNPEFLESEYPDDYCKFFLPGLSRVRPKGSLRIYNKVGRAYGFSVDNAYVFDIESGRSFFLSAVIYTNANGVLGDDINYEYEEVADIVMADLAEVVARELWQIPGDTSVSSQYDCIPSSMWKKLEALPPSVISETTSQHLQKQELTSLDDTVPDTSGDNDFDNSMMVGASFPDEHLNLKVRNTEVVPSYIFSEGTCERIRYMYFTDD